MSDINVFINHVGQTILAESVGDDKTSLKVKNPAILHVVPNQTGQLQVQLIPLFFREFIDSDVRNDGAVFNFNKSTVVTSEIKLEPKIKEQYERIFAPATAAPKSDAKGSPVIKLFDD